MWWWRRPSFAIGSTQAASHRGSVLAADAWAHRNGCWWSPKPRAGSHEDLLRLALGAPAVLAFDDDRSGPWLSSWLGHRQAQFTRELLDSAEAAGRQRQAQNHRTVLVNLDKIISSLQALRPTGADGVASAVTASEADPQWLLTLYVAGASPRSAEAIDTVRRICDEELAGWVDLRIVDVSERSAPAISDDIFAVPTLVKRSPPPSRRLVGNLADTDRVRAGLDLGPLGRDQASAGPNGEGRQS